MLTDTPSSRPESMLRRSTNSLRRSRKAIWELVGEVRQRLMTTLNPDGFNIGFNDGLAAGQTVAHAHVHVIPRRNGDVADPRGGIRWAVIAAKQPTGNDDRCRRPPTSRFASS